MARTSSLVLASAVAAAASVQNASAHSYMLSPVVEWPKEFYDLSAPFARLDSTKLSGMEGIPDYLGVKRIAAAIAASEEKTLRGLVYKYATTTADMACGKTVQTGPKQPVPDEIDFPWNHLGPCEAWCDDTRIFANEDCQGNKVGKIKVDKSKCVNAKHLQVMYAGVHVSNYEIFGKLLRWNRSWRHV